ncbi:MAG: 50S ribosomal protein L29 [Planctomycetota bacterium]|nr:50S ribosomal protein L29 [Planctomycetota bacterium]
MSDTPAKSLRDKTSQELQDQLLLEKKRLFDGVVKSSTGEAIKPHEKRLGRRLIARIQSIIREREVRRALDARIVALTPQAKDAGPEAARVVKKVEARVAEVQAALAKPAGERGKVKPMCTRVRMRDVKGRSAADRAAVQLAEAKRLRAAVEREDVGHVK